MFISDIVKYGDPWAVTYQLLNAGTAGESIVIPRDTTARTPTGGSDATRRKEDTRLVILGYHYDCVCAASHGFDLYWADQSFSPAGTPPTSPAIEQQYILRVRNIAGSAARVEGGTPFCFLPGPAGYITPGIFTPWNPADLVVAESDASAVTSGTLVIWGIEAPSDWRIMKKYTGSPVDMGA